MFPALTKGNGVMGFENTPKPEAPGGLSRLNIHLLISAQVTISRFLTSNPASGSVLTARSLLGILSLCPSCVLCLSK